MDQQDVTEEQQLLTQLYYDLDSPVALSTPRNLHKEAKKYFPKIKFKDVKNWLATQDTYTVHRPRIRHFRRRKTITRGIDDLHQMDLLDVTHLARQNRGVRFLLVCICCFSRYVQVRPLKRKMGAQVADAIETMYTESGRIPQRAQTDQGLEFTNVHTQTVFKKFNIHHYWTYSKLKAALAERLCRSLRSLIAKFLHGRSDQRYIDHLQKIVQLYNNRKHRGLGGKISPNQVTSENEELLWRKMYGNEFPSEANFRFHIGQKVKIVKVKGIFEKERTGSWTSEVYFIIFRRSTKPPTYKLMDKNKAILRPSFYEKEIIPAGDESE